MRRFVSVNVRSIGIYAFAMLICCLIIYGIIRSDPYLLVVFAPVSGWIMISFNLLLFSRCKFLEDEIVISGDFTLEKDQQIQKRHLIKYDDIEYCKIENLKNGLNTNHNEVKLTNKRVEEYRFFYGYDNIRCITFYMKNDEKQSLIINRYSEKQINEMFYLLRNKNMNISDYQVDESYLPPKKTYPRYLMVTMIITLVIFIGFSIYSNIIGGDAINGMNADKYYEDFVAGNYYVSSHGHYTKVSFNVWLSNLILGYLSILMFVIFFALQSIHYFKNRK